MRSRKHKVRYRIVRVGRHHRYMDDLYHNLLKMSWAGLFGSIIAAYLGINLVFAAVYYLDPRGVENMHPGSFADAFNFSVQTLATIGGYGRMAPRDLLCHLAVTAEALCGLLGFSTTAAVMFAKLSRPTARVRFSRAAVVAERDGIPSLMFRIANERDHPLLEARLRLVMFYNDVTAEGQLLRRSCELPLSRAGTPMFELNWLAVHPITERSPLFGQDRASLSRIEAAVMVSFVGVDSTLAQSVYAQRVYRPADLRWGEHFRQLIASEYQETYVVDYKNFNQTARMPDEVPTASAISPTGRVAMPLVGYEIDGDLE